MRSALNRLIYFFLLFQGLTFILEVPFGLLEYAHSDLMLMPISALAVDWGILALIATALNVLAALIFAGFVEVASRFSIFQESSLTKYTSLFPVSLVFCSAIYPVLLAINSVSIGFPNIAVIVLAIMIGGSVGFLAEHLDGTSALFARLRSAGILFSIIVLLASPAGAEVRIVDYNHVQNRAPSPSKAERGAPNVIVLVVDTLSMKAMSLYGDALPDTPALQQFAEHGTVLRGLIASSNFTVPNTATLLSGTPPEVHKLNQLGSYFINEPDFQKRYLLPNIFRSNGYNTTAIVANIVANPIKLRDIAGFDDVYTPLVRCGSVQNWGLAVQNANLTTTLNLFPVLSALQHVIWLMSVFNSTVTCDQPDLSYGIAETWLEHRRDGAKPYFLWIHTVPPHDPYLPPSPYMRMFYPGNQFTRWSDYWFSPVRFYKPPPHGQDAALHELSLRYRENIRYADAQIGAFLKFLSSRNFLANTIILITADHGETFRRWVGHDGPYLDQDLIEVPFIIAGPSIPVGRRVAMKVSQIDVAPTLLVLAGLSVPHQMTGHSFSNLFQAVPKDFHENIFVSQEEKNSRYSRLRSGTIAIIDGQWKYVRYLGTGKEELFDLAHDDNDEFNLVKYHRPVADRLWKILRGHYALNQKTSN